ncbi:MAG: thiamine phosphate synthase [Oligoflexus sp.]|nr:thiamine phosphate synthase [Oligoflexus sp.]
MKSHCVSSPAVWSLAGHDPFGGAGISADMRVATSLSVDLRTLITSLTAQNDHKMFAAEATSTRWLDEQWRGLSSAEKPAAFKLGLVIDGSTVRWLADHLEDDVPLIVDPVLASSSGTCFVADDLLENLREYLFQKIDILTPNRPEAERISGITIRNLDDVRKAAKIIRSQGVKAVLIKGGHSEGETVLDYFDDGVKPFILSAKRQAGIFRGTGCTLSTAIACYIAQGQELRDAVVAAHSYVQAAIAKSARVGSIHLRGVSETPPLSDLRYAQFEAGQTENRHEHELIEGGLRPLQRSLGFYPVLPNVEWIERFAKSGVKTLQLRIKDQNEQDLRRSIAKAKEICEANDIALFVNDAWQLAMEYQVYGVHLGQEDLDLLSPADLERIRNSGLRLGLSTHSLEEAARAKTLKPSYIALGPVFETTCKSMRFGPQGIPRVGEWVRRLPGVAVVAIGGLKLEHARAVRTEGADSIAVITDLIKAADPEHQMNEWLKAFQD